MSSPTAQIHLTRWTSQPIVASTHAAPTPATMPRPTAMNGRNITTAERDVNPWESHREGPRYHLAPSLPERRLALRFCGKSSLPPTWNTSNDISSNRCSSSISHRYYRCRPYSRLNHSTQLVWHFAYPNVDVSILEQQIQAVIVEYFVKIKVSLKYV